MELSKEHRAALINELEKAQKDAELQATCLEKSTEDTVIGGWFEIAHFLATERIKTIKQAITDNEIDY